MSRAVGAARVGRRPQLRLAAGLSVEAQAVVNEAVNEAEDTGLSARQAGLLSGVVAGLV